VNTVLTEEYNVVVKSAELTGTTKYLTQQTRCHIDQCHYNWVKVYSVPNVASIMIHDLLYIHNLVQTFCCH